MNDNNIDKLESRRKVLRLGMLYKIVNEQIPSIPPNQFLTQIPPKRKIKPRTFQDHQTENIIRKYGTNNNHCYCVTRSRTSNYRNSFFIRTVVDWNQLDEGTIMQPNITDFKQMVADTPQ